MGSCNEGWLDTEVNTCKFKDKRIKKRFRSLLEDLWNGVGRPIPLACQDWPNTKAAYRFLSNARVAENEIMQGHFDTTQQRFKDTKELESPKFLAV